MKRLRLLRWSGTVLSPRTRPKINQAHLLSFSRLQSTTSPSELSTTRRTQNLTSPGKEPLAEERLLQLPSPPVEAVHHSSAKLSALHARLSLPPRLPLETLARTLVDASADPSPQFNNKPFSILGNDLLGYYTSEYIVCQYPRLPLAVVYAAMYAYVGEKALAAMTTVYDDEFGEIRQRPVQRDEDASLKPDGTTVEKASSNFVRALMGAVYLHGGRLAAKQFYRQHFMSRQLAMSDLFNFRFPTRDLSRLCAREGFRSPVARILSETGRKSRHPVFVVGVYSGNDKLGEGAGSSLDEARTRAAVAALKGWYLYSPVDFRVPSETEEEGAEPWSPVLVDSGDIVV
jgi:dsRNA-specific ribonuclease